MCWKVGSLRVALPPGAFLQASAEGEEALCRFVTDNAGDARNVADLFAGCGTFAGRLLEKAAQITAVENDEDAVQALTQAGRDHKNLRTLKRDLFCGPLTTKELEAFDAVVLDPPRAGAREQCAALAISTVPRIIVISCDPGTFARDARILCEGGYTLQKLVLIDQFVWSAHVELAAFFARF